MKNEMDRFIALEANVEKYKAKTQTKKLKYKPLEWRINWISGDGDMISFACGHDIKTGEFYVVRSEKIKKVKAKKND